MSRLVLAFYSALLALALPVYRWRRRRSGRPAAPAAERTRGFPEVAGASIWLHAVSVGEVLALRSLIAGLREDYPDHEVLLSTTTVAGLEVARRSYPDLRVFHGPYDLKAAVERALDALRPKVLVLAELELWPRLLDVCRRRGIPVLLVNARVSARSSRGYRRLGALLPGLFSSLRMVLAQDEVAADRFRNLGIDAARIRVTGSIKVDNLPATVSQEAADLVRKELGLVGKLVLVAGSTHAGEDEVVFKATLAIRSHLSNMVLVLAPRHLERLPAIEATAAEFGLATRRRSEPQVSDGPVLLVDTMGELAQLFAAADLALLGGSLVPKGGHNVLEPAAAGRVQLIGPHHWTAADFAEELRGLGALIVVKDAEELAQAAIEQLRRPAERNEAGRAAQMMVARHRGATDRTRTHIREVFPPACRDE